jgi:hypothetical protein
MFSFCKHYFFQKFFCKEGVHCTEAEIHDQSEKKDKLEYTRNIKGVNKSEESFPL